jgi:polar amino acid transport system substrate-binding protein
MRTTQSTFSSILFSTLVVFTASTAQAQNIKLCHDDADSSPWLIKDGKGMNIVLMEAAAVKAGAKLDIVALPWKRCLAAVEDKSIDGAIAASYKDERAKFAVYPTAGDKPDESRRLHNEEYSLYRAKGNTVSWDGSKFSNLTGSIGAQRGYSIIDNIKNSGAKVDEGGALPKDNMKKLVAGQVQAVALTSEEGDQLSKAPEFAGKVDKLTPPLIQKPYYVIFGKDFYSKNQKVVENVWSNIATIRESKDYKAKVQAAFKKK